jgi:hypothetical protein
LSDVTVGEQVAVFGTETADTVTATSVAIGAPPHTGRPSGSPPGWGSGSAQPGRPPRSFSGGQAPTSPPTSG